MENDVEIVQMTDRSTGHKINPVTDYEAIKNLPNLLTDQDINVKDGYVGNPPSGPRVVSYAVVDSKEVNINNFKILYFFVAVTVNKEMFMAQWGDDNRILFSFPDDFDPNNTGRYSVQEMVGRFTGATDNLGINFREMNHKVYFDGFQNGSGIDPSKLPDNVQIELSGQFIKY